MKSIGIDIGTTTMSAAVIDLISHTVIESRTVSKNNFLRSENSWEKLQDPAEILEKAITLLDELLKGYPDTVSIGLTGQMHGILYVDQRGKHISPLYTWQDGSGDVPCIEGKSVCHWLKEKYQIKTYSGYGLVTHLYHLKTGTVPEGAVKICTIMDYFGMILTGCTEPIVHSSNAAGFGFYDLEKQQFQKEILLKLGVSEVMLPETTDDYVSLGNYHGIPVSIAVGDNQASFLGSISDPMESILLNMGTGGQISVFSDRMLMIPGIETRPLGNGKYLLVGASLCGGRAYAVLEQFFRSYFETAGIAGIDHYQVMEKLLIKRKEKEEKLVVNTCFSGTREEPEKTGSVTAITDQNFTPENLVYGVLEGMARELFEFYEKIVSQSDIRRSRIVASGNGFRKNRNLQKIISDMFGMKLNMTEYKEEAAAGAAWVGRKVLKVIM